MEALRPLEIRSIHDQVQERIKEHILANNLQPDDLLPSEAVLAEKLGVSRAVVREALRSLESMGVVHSRRGAGRFVSEFKLDPILDNLSYGMLFDTEELQEMVAIRECLEAGFIDDAIVAMDGPTLNRLRMLADEMRQKAAAGENFLEADLAFHRTIYLVTGNRLLIKLQDVFRTVYQNLQDRSLRVTRDLDAELRNHEQILQAIEAQDTESARRLLVVHFEGIKERLKSAQLVNETVRE